MSAGRARVARRAVFLGRRAPCVRPRQGTRVHPSTRRRREHTFMGAVRPAAPRKAIAHRVDWRQAKLERWRAVRKHRVTGCCDLMRGVCRGQTCAPSLECVTAEVFTSRTFVRQPPGPRQACLLLHVYTYIRIYVYNCAHACSAAPGRSKTTLDERLPQPGGFCVLGRG